MAVKNPSNGFFYMGEGTLKVPMTLFKENRERLSAALRESGSKNSIVLLQGGQEQGLCVGDSADVGTVFRQEAFFHWAFGVLEPDFYGAIDVDSGHSILFMPRLSAEYATWLGNVETTDECKERYQVDEVCYVDEIGDRLAKKDSATVLVLKGTNSDSGKATCCAHFDGIDKLRTDSNILYPIICELRAVKTEKELSVLCYIARVSSRAHKHVMKTVRAGMKEYQCESTFLNYCYYNYGCRHVSYTCICGSGLNGSILHYGHAGAPNDRTLTSDDIVLFDMGANYYGFCSDITCSYPVTGKFTDNQKVIYNAVLRACRAVVNTMKDGVCWKSMHLLANREMLEGLLEGGLLQGNIDDMMAVNLAGRVFQPHGLGHFMGLDVHDVGGYLDGQPLRPTGHGLKSLRTARILKTNNVITVEPGCYFNDFLLDAALADPELNKFLVPDRLNEFRGFGGVRIEEDVAVTADGCVVLSVVPRTVEEIEEWMSGNAQETLDPLST